MEAVIFVKTDFLTLLTDPPKEMITNQGARRSNL